MSATIQQQSDEFQADAGSRMPPEIAALFAGEQQRLREEGVPTRAVQVGDSLTSFTLLDAQSQPVTLGDLWADGPLVIVFYRGGWCPYCNIALRTYQHELLPKLDAFGARLVAISPQTPDESLSTKEKAELAFTVLSDPGNAAARELGITFQPADEVLAVQRQFGLDLSQVNTEGSTALPMPTVLIVDATGTVRFVDIHADYTGRTEVADILAALDRL
jgi:peroxiredoxin